MHVVHPVLLQICLQLSMSCLVFSVKVTLLHHLLPESARVFLASSAQ